MPALRRQRYYQRWRPWPPIGCSRYSNLRVIDALDAAAMVHAAAAANPQGILSPEDLVKLGWRPSPPRPADTRTAQSGRRLPNSAGAIGVHAAAERALRID
jgi:hypothetical protein